MPLLQRKRAIWLLIQKRILIHVQISKLNNIIAYIPQHEQNQTKKM